MFPKSILITINFLFLLFPVKGEESDCKTLVGSAATKLKEWNHLGTLPVWGPSWEIRFEIYFNSISSAYWFNIFRFSSIDGNCCKIGQRIPALWTRKGTKDKLNLHTSFDSDGDYYISDELGTFTTHRWYQFVISQKKFQVQLLIEESL